MSDARKTSARPDRVSSPPLGIWPCAEGYHFRAAEGWLELGSPSEALLELRRLPQVFQLHPDALHLRWCIGRALQDWGQCLRTAWIYTGRVPLDPRGWMDLAHTFYDAKRHEDAYRVAASKVHVFPASWPLHYDAACYASLTGRIEQASQFLGNAMFFGSAQRVMLLAVEDPDLAEFWARTDNPSFDRHVFQS